MILHKPPVSNERKHMNSDNKKLNKTRSTLD